MNYFNDIGVALSEEEFNEKIAGLAPVFYDGAFAFYRDEDGNMYVGTALDAEVVGAAPNCFSYVTADAEEYESYTAEKLDRGITDAVREAGFATEPLRHLVEELYRLLYLRMLRDPRQGFTNQEWEVCKRAREELGIAPAHRAETQEG